MKKKKEQQGSLAVAAPSPETVARVIIEENGIISRIAKRLGVTSATVYNWKDKYEWVAKAINRSRESVLDEAETALFKAVKAGEPWAVKFILSSLGKTRGYTGPSTNHTTAIQVNIVGDKSESPVIDMSDRYYDRDQSPSSIQSPEEDL